MEHIEAAGFDQIRRKPGRKAFDVKIVKETEPGNTARLCAPALSLLSSVFLAAEEPETANVATFDLNQLFRRKLSGYPPAYPAGIPKDRVTIVCRGKSTKKVALHPHTDMMATTSSGVIAGAK